MRVGLDVACNFLHLVRFATLVVVVMASTVFLHSILLYNHFRHHPLIVVDAGEGGGTVMKWSDDGPVNYSPLYVDEHGEGDEECFQLGVVQGKKLWTRANGCEGSAPFVCKKLASVISAEWNTSGLGEW